MRVQKSVITVAMPFLVATVITGCSNETPSVATATPGVTAISNPSVSEQPVEQISKEDAGNQYLRLVQPSNDLGDRAREVCGAADYQACQEATRALMDSYREFADGLTNSSWPSDAQPAVEGLITDLASDIIALSAVINQNSEESFWYQRQAWLDSVNQSNAQTIRVKLGLPNVPSVDTAGETTAPIPDVEPNAGESVSRQNAIEKAERYLDNSPFSRSGLIKQLEHDGFPHEDAEYAVNQLTVDWTEQAVKKAQQYLNNSAFSRSGLIKQLEYGGFTTEQATSAVDTVYK